MNQNKTRYQNSECRGGYLHKYRIINEYNGGLVERCERCGDKQFFPSNTPNYKYLSYHIRQALQVDDPRFLREYPNNV
jgi:hypothetical protein